MKIVDKYAFQAIIAFAELSISIREENEFVKDHLGKSHWKILKEILLEQVKIIKNIDTKENEWLRTITMFGISANNFLVNGLELVRTFMLGLGVSTNKENPNEIYDKLVKNFKENKEWFQEMGANTDFDMEELERKFRNKLKS